MKTEPLLMPNQDKPFNGDRYMCEEFLKLQEKFNITTAVELGSCVGGTTRWLCDNFDKVYTIEINADFRNFCLERIKDKTNCESLLGSTVDLLPDVLKYCGNNTIIHQDSHWLDNVPLLKELEIIAESGLTPVIEIHDFKVPEHPELGFDAYKGQAFDFEWIKPYIERIYGEDGYEYHYNSVAEGAMRGAIYIYPKQ